MKPATIVGIVAWICLGWLPACPVSAGQMTRFVAVKGKIRIEGTSNIDTWQVESKSPAGYLEAGPELTSHGSQKALPGPLDAHAEISVETRSLKSVEKDGKPFSNKMDEILYEALRARESPKTIFRLSRLALRVASPISSSPSELDAHGQLVVAGVANETTFPIHLQALPDNQLRIWGTTTLKMTDFRVDPPSPTITLGIIKTDDEVKVVFDLTFARHH
jgi:hypothetical protein